MYPYADNPPDECYHCLEKANRIQDVSYWFNAILDQLYDREEFNSEELERYLDEMAGCLNMKLPSGHLVVTKENPKNDILDEWKTFNNQYLISLKSMGV